MWPQRFSLVYGDHLPYLGDSQLGYREIGSEVALTESDRSNPICSYETPYLLWVNDAAAGALDWENTVSALDLPADGRLSACFLGETVLELTGREQSNAWFAFLSQLRRETPVVQKGLYAAGDGSLHTLSQLTEAQQEDIARWRRWSYYKLQQKELR